MSSSSRLILRPTDPWLTGAEQQGVCDALLRFNCLKWADSATLPLKSGGKTDIYVNQRNARAVPGAEASKFLGSVYGNALRRLDLDGFAEVPDAVSCFAPYVAQCTGLPQITVREVRKEGRATGGTFVGDVSLRPGSFVDLFDDVITDGESKVGPFWALRSAGYNVHNVVVLVDRQQGWKKKFAELGIPLNVWAGMTLHDLRRMLLQRRLIRNVSLVSDEGHGLILALDALDFDEALPVLAKLRGSNVILKANDMAANRGIDWILENLSVYGRVMLDLKFYDISNTLLNYCKHILRNPPWAITVHASAGRGGLKAVADFIRHHNLKTKLLAITALTSFSKGDCQEIYRAQPSSTVKRLARIAAESGADGFVCSPLEAKLLRKIYPKLIRVTPGIRASDAKPDDQNRTATIAEAVANGSDYAVIGRPIMQATDPAAAALQFEKEGWPKEGKVFSLK